MASQSVMLILLLLHLLTISVSDGNCAINDKPLVRFGINLRHSPISLYERYQPLMDYLTRNPPYRFELKISRTYQEALKDLNAGRTQIASLGDGAFIEAILFHGATPVVKPLGRDGKPFYRCVIVVQAGSRMTGLADLRGKRVAFGSRHSVSGNLIPRLLFDTAGVRSAELSHSSNLDNHTAVAKAVLKGMFDAGALKDVFAQRYERYGLRLLASSDPIPTAPLVAGENAPKKLVKAVADALLKLDPGNPGDRITMSVWDKEFQYGFAPAHPADYRDLFRKFRSIPNGCAGGCH